MSFQLHFPSRVHYESTILILVYIKLKLAGWVIDSTFFLNDYLKYPMIKAPILTNDDLRVQNLYDLEILDTNEEDDFTNITRLASSVCNTPIALISLLDNSREWFKAKVGISMTQVNRNISFCGHAIAQDNDFFQIENTLKDVRFFDNPLVVSAPYIRFYAGVQLISKGLKLGMLCVKDTKPGLLTQEQIFALRVLANCVTKLLELRRIHKQSDEKTLKIKAQDQMQERLLSMIAHDAQLYQMSRSK